MDIHTTKQIADLKRQRDELHETTDRYLNEIRELKARLVPQETEFEVIQDDLWVAGCSGPRDKALAEAQHYLLVYSQDGLPLEINEIIRIPVS